MRNVFQEWSAGAKFLFFGSLKSSASDWPPSRRRPVSFRELENLRLWNADSTGTRTIIEPEPNLFKI